MASRRHVARTARSFHSGGNFEAWEGNIADRDGFRPTPPNRVDSLWRGLTPGGGGDRDSFNAKKSSGNQQDNCQTPHKTDEE